MGHPSCAGRGEAKTALAAAMTSGGTGPSPAYRACTWASSAASSAEDIRSIPRPTSVMAANSSPVRVQCGSRITQFGTCRYRTYVRLSWRDQSRSDRPCATAAARQRDHAVPPAPRAGQAAHDRAAGHDGHRGRRDLTRPGAAGWPHQRRVVLRSGGPARSGPGRPCPFGVRLDRLVLVPCAPEREWPRVVATLADACAIAMARSPEVTLRRPVPHSGGPVAPPRQPAGCPRLLARRRCAPGGNRGPLDGTRMRPRVPAGPTRDGEHLRPGCCGRRPAAAVVAACRNRGIARVNEAFPTQIRQKPQAQTSADLCGHSLTGSLPRNGV
jgi:hypothetical protein